MQEENKYRKYVNGRQTKEERKTKYQFLKLAGYNTSNAKRMRDWTMNHIILNIKSTK